MLPRLNGISDRLWTYDSRHHKGWQLDTDSRRPARPRRTREKGAFRLSKQQERLRHYIGAGGMRHAARDRQVRQRLPAGQDRIWKLFACYVLVWLIFRWIPC